jgi:hypothetical protein
MTAQEMFDTVARHLLKQNERSINDSRRCMYRGPRGLKCAVGVLIPDENYSKDFEGMLVSTPSIRNAAGIPDDLLDLAHTLQSVHDNALSHGFNGEENIFTMGLLYVANTFKLSTAVLNEVKR